MSSSLDLTRTDFAFPFRIDTVSGQAARGAYADHVDQMIRQILLTDPGERVCLPTFGAGLRRLVFSPLTSQLQTSATMIIIQSLNAWLGNQITVNQLTLQTPASTPGAPDGTVQVLISYILIETQAIQQTQILVT
jgi:Bacteriophage baseplate protein W